MTSSLHPSPSLIEEADQFVFNLKNHSGSAIDHAKTLRQLDKLRCLLHKGQDALMYQAYPFQILPAMNVLSDFQVFDAVPLEGSISVEELAEKVKLDATVLSRFLRIVLTQAIFNEKAPGVYEHTQASAVFRTDQAASFFRLGTMQFPAWWRVSSYLRTHPASAASDPRRVPYSWATGREGKTYYEAIEEDPTVSDTWHKGMVLIERTQPILGMFPFASMKNAVLREPERAFVVDVGGGRGNALVAIRGECEREGFKGRLVLQDMREVLEGADPVRVEGVEVMVHDFFEEQPVKNAQIYHLRNILHNHTDARSLHILAPLVRAMAPDSLLLLGEMILPATAAAGADPFPWFMDLNMFMEGGLERTEEHWRRLLGQAGLRMEGVWRDGGNEVVGMIGARRM